MPQIMMFPFPSGGFDFVSSPLLLPFKSIIPPPADVPPGLDPFTFGTETTNLKCPTGGLSTFLWCVHTSNAIIFYFLKQLIGCPKRMGVYLTPSQRVYRLPGVIDPPFLGIDAVSSNFSVAAHHALPLFPTSMHLGLLVNVHKRRFVARTVKSFVAKQHLTS
jgi:hypothetical protein